MTQEKKGPEFTRHKILTLYYEDEGGGNGAMILDTPQGSVHIGSIGAAGVYSFNWAQMLKAGPMTLHVNSNFAVTHAPREPLVVLAEETLKKNLKKPLPP